MYVRDECHLCEDMITIVNSHEYKLNQKQFTLELIDVDSKDALIQQYGLKIPVLVFLPSVDDHGMTEEVCHYYLDQKAFLAYLN